jgi:hypothetical protein
MAMDKCQKCRALVDGKCNQCGTINWNVFLFFIAGPVWCLLSLGMVHFWPQTFTTPGTWTWWAGRVVGWIGAAMCALGFVKGLIGIWEIALAGEPCKQCGKRISGFQLLGRCKHCGHVRFVKWIAPLAIGPILCAAAVLLAVVAGICPHIFGAFSETTQFFLGLFFAAAGISLLISIFVVLLALLQIAFTSRR